MKIPKAELPDMEEIKAWAQSRLPDHYELTDVRLQYDAGDERDMPEDFEIVFEYLNDLDAQMTGTVEAIQAHHDWADPIIDKIRAKWSAQTIRIKFESHSERIN